MERETLTLNIRGYMQIREKALEENPERKPRIETRSRLVVNTNNFPVAPATRSSPTLMLCILLDLVGADETGVAYSLDSAQPPYTIAQERLLQSN